ncbi:MAG: type II toxin-antitoxin system RelE/ParE family toxin [Nanoarchaeota archaeon]|nr:type II toxin-antitoxin system RelE/ParE family toxin [Nanoarchaeota archaeon]
MYNLNFSSGARKFFRKLTNFDKRQIGKKIEELKQNPELGKPLTGKLSGLWSLRIGKFRVLYQVRKNELIILILKIGHRKNIYER